MPLPSGLKIEPAKVILFLKLKLIDLPLFYSPPLEGCPQGGVAFYWYNFKSYLLNYQTPKQYIPPAPSSHYSNRVLSLNQKSDITLILKI
ncbi:hypothetical protein IQ02_01497 [Flavobacterium glaciei]|uniref:Uncharacterized protein n=1 Tax=Flavobacterium glaciei TaxID=386300 RepID=A0A562PUS2_9FLAO|nr:hypothetical protein DFR66_106110 [Flavobacterium glaciei]TWI47910.1 hypothetical protein IQ02_01497 [Flavobacterium glaciei]